MIYDSVYKEMKKRIIYIFILSCIGLSLQAQEYDFLNYSENTNLQNKNKQTFKHNLLNEIDSHILDEDITEKAVENYSPIKNEDKLIKDIDFSLSMGTMVGVANKDMYYSNSYILPSARFKLSDKLTINTGIGYSYGMVEDYLMFNPERKPNGSMMNVNSLFAYVSAVYSVTPKTSILASGTVNHQMYFQGNNGGLNQTYSDVSLGINYKVTSNFSFNAQVNFGNSPNYYTIFNPGGIYMSPGIGF